MKPHAPASADPKLISQGREEQLKASIDHWHRRKIDTEEKEFIVILMLPDGDSGLLQGFKHTKTKITVYSFQIFMSLK